jgi:protein-L-isoaspartate(D-aspartate) O-methyltransferase
MARQKEMAQMLEDIRLEVELTARYTGYQHFSDAVMRAMATVPRHLFVPDEMQPYAYANGPLAIGHGQTISQPYIVALMSELLAVTPDARVLEVGTGSGYQTAVLSRLVKQVYSIEIVEALSVSAGQRLRSLGYANIETRAGDGYQGWPEQAPFDGIIVTAAAPHIPDPLVEQLKTGARLVVPVGQAYGSQELLIVEKGEQGTTDIRQVLPVAFVPLVRRQETP